MVLSPCDWRISGTTVFVPDLMVVRLAEIDLDGPVTSTPVLAVDVRSPLTATADQPYRAEHPFPVTIVHADLVR